MFEKLKYFDIKYKSRKFIEKLWLWFIWKLPRKLIYWSSIRLMANATTGEYSSQEVSKINIIDALSRWERCQKH